MNSLLTQIRTQALQQPEASALIGEHSHYSYQQLLQDSEKLAEQIKAHHINTLALLADNGPEWVVVDLACQIAECCFIPLPLFFSPTQIQHSLHQAGVDTLLLGNGIPVATELAQLEPINGLADGFRALRLPVRDKLAMPVQTHKITFTSGSTGQPRGVCLSTAQQLQVAESLVTRIAIEQPRHLCVLPLATLLENIAGVYAPLMAGGSVYLPSLSTLGFSGSSSVEAEKLLTAISHYQPQSLILIPQLLDLLTVSVMQGWQAPESLQMIAVGGSRVAASAISQARQLGLPVYEGYGLSECASVVSLNTPRDDRPGSAGKLLPHLDVQIIDGEIHIIGNSFLGYLNDPASWYAKSVATGDLGYIDEAGFLQLQGRKKHLLISSYGRNINPEWVESEILAQPLIQQCIVLGDARPCCSALIYADQQHLSDKQIQQWLDQVNQSLPDYAQIKKWLRLSQALNSHDQLLTANGRPRREAINEYYSSAIEQLYCPEKEYYNMSFFQRLQQETTAEREQFFTAPIIQQTLSGQVSLADYVAFLSEAYHHVKHTVPLLMAVGARIPEEKEWLREAVAEYIEEELGHQEWILNDIAACGYDKEKVRHSKPSMATELMVSYAYDMVNRVNPLGFFGMVHVLEGSSVSTADLAADAIKKTLGLPDRAFSYLRSHGALDQEHVKFFESLMDRIEDPAEQDCIIRSAKMFYQLYGNIFRGLTADNLNQAA